MIKKLKRSPHFAQHINHEPKGLFDFAGWEMPTHFSSLEEEIWACRNAAILFDGHAMGELHVTGKDALKAVQKVCANDISKGQPGRLIYTSLCTENGGIFDDLVVFCIAPDHYLLTVAAFNVDKVPDWVRRHTAGMNVCICDRSAGTTCLEIQGPESREILASVAEFDVSDSALPYYRFIQGNIQGIDCLVARLGVTGELGYEIFYDPGYAYQMYDILLEAGDEFGLALCGNRTIGVMRLEKVYHVYTREIDESTNPFEAGLGKAVKLEKGDFVGRAALLKIKESGLTRKLVGFSAGHGGQVLPPKSSITADGKTVGYVTVMAASPTVGETIGLGYVSIEHSDIGASLTVSGAGEQTDVTVVRTPFFDPEGTRIRG